jgi:pimeloyl-ACP methyl ester carboxylesterase
MDLGDVRLYYEQHGATADHGPPLVLLHGGFGSSEMFGSLLPALSARRRVVTLDFRAHGRTADTPEPVSPQLFASDVVALLDRLGIAQADLLGYSMGAGVALQLGFRHAERARRLVVVSYPFKRDGWFADPQLTLTRLGPDQAVDALTATALFGAYRRVAPDPGGWRALVLKSRRQLAADYDWSAQVRQLTSPTLLVAGDADGVPVSLMAEFFALLGGGVRDGRPDHSGMIPHALAILPHTAHYDLLSSPVLVPIVTGFLERQAP